MSTVEEAEDRHISKDAWRNSASSSRTTSNAQMTRDFRASQVSNPLSKHFLAPADGFFFLPVATQRSPDGGVCTQRDELWEKKEQVKSVCAATREKQRGWKVERGPPKKNPDRMS